MPTLYGSDRTSRRFQDRCLERVLRKKITSTTAQMAMKSLQNTQKRTQDLSRFSP